MSNNIVNRTPFLRTSREIPEDLHQLTVEVNKAYVDIAEAVNRRTIGLFPVNQPAITGESWFITTSRQQTLRQVYNFTTTTPILHGINFTQISAISRMYGQFTDGTNWYGLIAASNVAIAGQVSFFLSPTSIILLGGGGTPALTRGIIVLEWLSNV